MSKISIIVPVYKAEAFLHRCVDSILCQSLGDFDLILVDDGSPDSCGAICDEYAARDPRIHVLHQQNQGVSVARNAGIDWVMENTNSQWITFVDSDDWLHRDCLKILLEAAETAGAKISACDCIWTSGPLPDGQLQGCGVSVLEPEDAFVAHYPKFLPPWGKLFQRSLLEAIRFPVGIRYEDAAIMHLLVFAAGKIAVCPEKLYYYFDNADSFTRIAWRESHLQVVQVHWDRLNYLREQGLQRAYRRELEEYVERITSNLCSMTDVLDADERYPVLFEELREKLRSAVREAEQTGVFHLDRERLMTYMYVCPGDLVWKSARMLQRIWRRLRKR